MKVNGNEYPDPIEPRQLLSDYLRHGLKLTGTHVGCEHGVCGCCTVLFDGRSVRSCLMLAVQALGHELMTVEGLGSQTGQLHPIQQAFHKHHALQCGFCTPGFLMVVAGALAENPAASPTDMEAAIAGNLCRCTGYAGIRQAVASLAKASAT